MDEYLDQFLNAKESLPWDFIEYGQPNELLSNPVGMHEGENESSPVSYSVNSVAAQDSILHGESECVLDKSLLLGSQDYNGNSPLNGTVNGVGREVLRCNTLPNPGSLSFVPQKQLLQVDGLEGSSLSNLVSEHHRYKGNNEPFQGSLGSYQNCSPNPQFWPLPSYEGVSSLPPVIGENRLPDFGQGKYVDYDKDVLGNRYTGFEKIMELDNLSSSVTPKGTRDSQNYGLSSLDAGLQIPMKTYGFQTRPQVSSTNHSGSCNGTAKSRIRAPRGQATDPHSIAERLRREKISERMKNLQELVPKSEKTDKASMLDEIIDYVKFLQLQVKVLSSSRQGATESDVPLLTDRQAQGSNGVTLLPSTVQTIDICHSPNQIAFEQEVVKLMESNVNTAMQHLQSKGLCLMPLALASAISSEKASLSVLPENAKKFGSTNGLFHTTTSNSSNNLLAMGTHQVSLGTRKLTREGDTPNGSNGTTKHGELETCSCNGKEMRPKK